MRAQSWRCASRSDDDEPPVGRRSRRVPWPASARAGRRRCSAPGESSTTRAGPSRRASPSTRGARRAASRPDRGARVDRLSARRPSPRRLRRGRPPRRAGRAAGGPRGRRPSGHAQTLSTASSARSWPRQSASAPACEGPDGALLDADRVRHGAHLERVGDHEPVEAELVAQQPRRARVRLSVAGASSSDGTTMCAVMIALTSGLDRRAERQQRRLEVALRRAAARGASPGRCRRGPGSASRRRRRGSAGAPRRTPRTCRATSAGIGAERADADHGVVGIRVHVRAGSEVEVDAGPGAERADRGADLGRDGHVVDDAEREVARERAAGRDLEPGDVAALLVRGHEHGRVLGAQRRRQPGDLLDVADVPARTGTRRPGPRRAAAAPTPAARDPGSPARCRRAPARRRSALNP